MSDSYDPHRDTLSALAGVLQGYHEMSKEGYNNIDQETVKKITETFNEKLDEYGAKTPKAEID